MVGKNSMKSLTGLWLLFCLLALPYSIPGAQEGVRIWQEPLLIPTYRVEAPEPNPIFYNGRAYQGARGLVYPYPLLDRLSDQRLDRAYEAVYLENRYLKLCVLPEIGGRLFAAQDKTNGYDFIYRQHVIKPALIGMLGAWISGGVEWNIPHHHRATTFLSVDHTLVQNPDGSATVWVGEIELRHRSKWLVGLTLYPDRSLIEVTIKMFNRTALPYSLLCWANAAIHATPEYQIFFPPDTEFATFHGKNQFARWPVAHEIYNHQDYSRGVDISWWKSHAAPTSFFAWNSLGNFLAGYDHGHDAGVALVADHHQVPGKKLWTWGTGSEGKRWEKILTETDGPYAELMVGAFSDNQPDYSWSQPGEVKTVRQYWYPLRGLRGVKEANAEAAANLEILEANRARIGLNATAPHAGVRVSLLVADRTLAEETISIGPDQPYSKEIALPAGTREEELTLRVRTAENRELLTYRPPQKESRPLPAAVAPPPPPKDIQTNEELYLAGLRLEQLHNPAFEPVPYYEEALRRDPDDYRSNTALGILYLKRALFAPAEEKLQRAVRRSGQNHVRPKDTEAWYYLGVAQRSLGRNGEADEAFNRAAWSPAWQAATFYQLAELACCQTDWPNALEQVNQALTVSSLSTRALDLKAAILRKLASWPESAQVAAQALAIDPLDFWAANERCLALSGQGQTEKSQELRQQLSKLMRDVPANYLELAVSYGNAGFWPEAVEVLRLVASRNPKGAGGLPLVYYYLAYYAEKSGDLDQAQQWLRLAPQANPDYCFPFQAECIPILEWAQRKNPADSRAPYYLGNFLFDLQPDRAIGEWEKAARLDGRFSVPLRNLGLAYARTRNDLTRAIAWMEKAIAANPQDPRLYFEMDQFCEAANRPPLKRLALLEKNQVTVARRDDALAREISLLIQAGAYDRAIRLLSSHHFHVWEGGGEIHLLFVEALMLRGQRHMQKGNYRSALNDFATALTYPDNLEVAAPSSGAGSAQIFYWIGRAREALGQSQEAGESYRKAAGFGQDWSEESYYRALALQKLGRETEAQDTFSGLLRFAEQRLAAAPALDFFEKFGEKQSARQFQAQAHFLRGLGLLGLGKKEAARAEFAKALEPERQPGQRRTATVPAALNPSVRRPPDYLALGIDIGQFALDLHQGQALIKIFRAVVLQRDNDFSLLINKAPLVVDLHRGQPVAEIIRFSKLRFDGHCAFLVDVGHLPFDHNRGQPLGKEIGHVKLRLDDPVARLVDVAPLVAGHHQGQAFGKPARTIRQVKIAARVGKLQGDNDLAGLVDEARFAAALHCGQPFGKRAGPFEFQLNDCFAGLVDIAVFVPHIDSGQPGREGHDSFEFRLYEQGPLLVDKTPFLANAHRSQPFRKDPSLVELGLDDHGALGVDVAPFAVNLHRRQTLREIVGRAGKLRLDDHLPGLVNITVLAVGKNGIQNSGWLRLFGRLADDDQCKQAKDEHPRLSHSLSSWPLFYTKRK